MSAITIRPYEPADAEGLFNAATESAHDMFPWLPWCHPEYTLGEAEGWIALCEANRLAGSEFHFAILSALGEFLGGCGINGLNREHQFANLGYWVRSSAVGKGVATAATQLIRDWAFGNTDLVRLEIVAATGNHASARVAEKSGAIHEGRLHDRLAIHGKTHDANIYSFVRSAG